MRKPKKTLIFLYEKEHIPFLFKHFSQEELNDRERFLIVAPDPELEILLEEEKLPFFSLRDFHLSYPHFALREWVTSVSENWYQSPDMSFFSHDDVLLGRGLELALSMYILRVGYFSLLF